MVPGKTNSFLDPVREHQLDIFFVGFIHNSLRTQSSFLFCFLLGQDVILVGTLALDLTGTSHFEALLRT
jgi:hypothetical protein